METTNEEATAEMDQIASWTESQANTDGFDAEAFPNEFGGYDVRCVDNGWTVRLAQEDDTVAVYAFDANMVLIADCRFRAGFARSDLIAPVASAGIDL